MPRLSNHRWTVVAAVLGATSVVVALRHGVIPTGDAVSYFSAAVETSHGRLMSSGLVPGFSGFSAARLLANGHVPFTDFAVGYPTVVGALGSVFGVKRVIAVVAVVAGAATVALLARGPHPAGRWQVGAARTLVGVGVLGVPETRGFVIAALPELTFIAVLLAVAITQTGVHRDGRPSWWPSVWGAAASLVRFQGLAIGLVLGAEELRHRRWRRALGVTVVSMGPALVNMAIASRLSEGRQIHWYGFERNDVESMAAAVGGWLSSAAPSLPRVYAPGPTVWWTILALLAWGALAAWATLAWWRGRGLTPALRVCLVLGLANVMVIGAVMLMFDALTVPEPRMLWPVGVLTAAGAVWSWRGSTTRSGVVGLAVSGLWLVSAAPPWRWFEVNVAAESPAVAVARRERPAAVISNAADPIYWATQIPSAYLPRPFAVQSRRPLDQDAAYASLACDLATGRGLVIVDTGGYIPPGDALTRLDALAAAGQLIAHDAPSVRWYSPSPTACSGATVGG